MKSNAIRKNGKTIEDLIAMYLESKERSFAPSTLKSEQSRLNQLKGHLDGDAVRLYTDLKGKNYGRYTITTNFVRAASFWDFLVKEGHARKQTNPYREFRTENARLFRNNYVRKHVPHTFEEIKDKVATITDPIARAKAEQLLFSGMRFTESNTLSGGEITGKGGKVRRLLGEDNPLAHRYKRSHRSFIYDLAKVGLKPHDLRKAYASLLVREGMDPFDLCKVMGWADVNTALCYVGGTEEKELKDRIKQYLRQKRETHFHDDD